MKPRERIQAALAGEQPDRTPLFEIWIDACLDELGGGDPQAAYRHQDCVMLPSQTPPGSNAWRDGVDEFGRVWHAGMYVTGQLDSPAALERFTPSASYLDGCFDADQVAATRARFPDHCLIYGTHIGPFTAAYMAMGFERLFMELIDNPAFIHQVLENRTAWCIAQYQRAQSLGAELLVLGDDVAARGGPMIAPRMCREFILPYHRRIVEALDVPVIWHSDGDIRTLLPMAIEAGFVGVHGLEPAAGIDLGVVLREFGQDLVLIGNVDVAALLGDDVEAVRCEVERCMAQGAAGRYMFASCNSIFEGMNPQMVTAMVDFAHGT